MICWKLRWWFEISTRANVYIKLHSFKSVESIVALEKFSSNLFTVINLPNPDFINLRRMLHMVMRGALPNRKDDLLAYAKEINARGIALPMQEVQEP